MESKAFGSICFSTFALRKALLQIDVFAGIERRVFPVVKF